MYDEQHGTKFSTFQFQRSNSESILTDADLRYSQLSIPKVQFRATAPDPVSLVATAGIGHYGHTARDVRHRDPVALALAGLRAGSWSLLSGGYFTSRTWRYLFRLEKAWWLSERYDVLLRLERLVVARRDGSGQYNFTVGLTHHFT